MHVYLRVIHRNGKNGDFVDSGDIYIYIYIYIYISLLSPRAQSGWSFKVSLCYGSGVSRKVIKTDLNLFSAYAGVVWRSLDKNNCSWESICSEGRSYMVILYPFYRYGVSFQICPLFYIMPYEGLCVYHRMIPMTKSCILKQGKSEGCDLEIWWMTLENNRAPLLYYIKFCASFQSHG